MRSFSAWDLDAHARSACTCMMASCHRFLAAYGFLRSHDGPGMWMIGYLLTLSASEHAGEEVGDSTFPLLRSCYLSTAFDPAFKTPELCLSLCVFSHSLSVHVCLSSCCLFGPSVCRSIQYAGECRWAPVSVETIIARTGGCRRSVGTGEHDADFLRWESSSLDGSCVRASHGPVGSACTAACSFSQGSLARTLVHLSLATVSSGSLGP
jgi:hypothetical protein